MGNSPSTSYNYEYIKVIQSAARGYLIQKSIKKHLIPEELFNSSVKIVLSEEALKNAEHPIDGKSRDTIFMIKELPIVIRPKNMERFHKAWKFREICLDQKYTNIVIPEITLHGKYSIEKRIPNTNKTVIDALFFYMDNKENYTEAVKEFTALLCHLLLKDLVGGSSSLFNHFTDSRVPRYDNVLLFSEKTEKGTHYKIGLIDTEHCQLEKSKFHFEDTLDTAIAFFPYHFDEIIEIGKKHASLNNTLLTRLKNRRDGYLEIFKVVEGHKKLLEQRGVTVTSPIKSFSMDDERKNSLIRSLTDYICQNESFSKDDALIEIFNYVQRRKKLSEEQKELIRKEFAPWILESIIDWLEKKQQKCVMDGKNAFTIPFPPASLSDLMLMRFTEVPYELFKDGYLYSLFDNLELIMEKIWGNRNEPNYKKDGFICQVIDRLFELMDGNEITFLSTDRGTALLF